MAFDTDMWASLITCDEDKDFIVRKRSVFREYEQQEQMGKTHLSIAKSKRRS